MSDKAMDPAEQSVPGNLTCTHCGAVLTPAMSYCPACGTAAAAAARQNPVFDVAREMTSYESGIWRTVGALLTRPGLLTAEWVQGHRAAYTSPAKLVVVVTMVAFLLFSAFDRMESWHAPDAAPVAPLAKGVERPELEIGFGTGGIWLTNIELYATEIETLGVDGFLRSRGFESGSMEHFAISRAIRKYQSNGWAAAQSNYQRNMSLLIYLLIPVFPLLMMLILPRRPYDQHVVFCLHAVSFFFIVACIFTFLGIWFWDKMFILAVPATLVYLVIALRRVYELKWWRAIPSGLFLGSLALSLSGGLAFISALLVVSL